jgi:hypothetical protein
MWSIDVDLTTQPSSGVLAKLTTTGLAYLGWESVRKTNQTPGDRRTNLRELTVHA